MPWQQVIPMEQRLAFVREFQLGCDSMTELARRYGVAPKTGYKWLARYTAEGVAGLVERSRRPHSNARAVPASLVDAILAARRAHPTWGAGKLLAWVRARDPVSAWPHRATVCDLLRRADVVRPRRRRAGRAASGRALTAPADPNALWTIDFKGQFRVGDGRVCYPLTLRDAASRYLLRCAPCAAPETHVARRQCERAFVEYGLPLAIGSDNGSPFGSTGLRRLSRLSVWWLRLGIGLVRIRPGHPEDNGSHEQFHRVLKAETARPPADTFAAQAHRFRQFQREYNDERPHEAHGQRPPALFYRRSPRAYPRVLPAVAYAPHLEVRRVASNGCVKWRGRYVYLTEVLTGEDVGWEEVGDGLWAVSFGTLLLGRFDERQRRFQPAGGV